MTVYVVTAPDGYGDTYVCGVFSTLDGAEQFRADKEMIIEEFVVDEVPA